MKKEEIEYKIRANMAESQIGSDDIRVQADPYGGWRIAVISDDFAELTPAERRGKLLAGLETADIEWTDFLTHNEVKWHGGLPSLEPEEELPLWPEALARGTRGRAELKFPSDQDEDLDPPIVVTFYSLRGGVGRSTALAHTARLLAGRRKKILCVDMDLEAPGLAALFGVEDQIQDKMGVARLLLEFDQGEIPDPTNHLVRLRDDQDLYVLPAGKITPDYARILRLLDPNSWYREEANPLRALMNSLRTRLPFTPDAILVDSRTGITPMSGPMLFEQADIAVVVLFPHPQAHRGTGLLVKSLLGTTTYRNLNEKFAPEVRFIVSPIPASRETMMHYEQRAFEWTADWLSDANEVRGEQEYIDESEITLLVPYTEAIAASDSALEGLGAENVFAPVRDWILRFIPSSMEQSSEGDIQSIKPRILEQLRFSAGTAELQEAFLDNFVQTDLIRDAVKGSIPLVLGRKGTGKTAVFRWLLESNAVDSICVHAPSGYKEDRPWILSSEGLRTAGIILKDSGLSWTTFWAFYVCVAVSGSLVQGPAIRGALEGITFESEDDMLNGLRRVAVAPDTWMEVAAWLRKLDESLSKDTLLLFDGLDTGFGSNPEARRLRREAIEGLFDLWMDRAQELNHLRFKIVLREDIWRELRFENKSHLFGRSVLLKWADQATYFKVVLKQAMRIDSFRNLVAGRPGGKRLVEGTVDDWAGEDVWQIWTLLVGERMKGGKTAFTRNWVWNRLADANNDRTPRSLLQLFHEAQPWEQHEHNHTPYDRSIIRPRALIKCLPTVSQQALEALREEFNELDPLLTELGIIGRSPINSEDLKRFDQEIALAQEVGLLSVYGEHGIEAKRYRVPDIYRLALGMARKGQA